MTFETARVDLATSIEPEVRAPPLAPAYLALLRRFDKSVLHRT